MAEEELQTVEESDADKYLRENPDIYKMFAHYTWEAVMAGVKKIGARLIFERMRWETTVRGQGDYKLNNNYTPALARRFMKENPHAGPIFETRGGKDNEVEK